jgi:hypothetical protein
LIVDEATRMKWSVFIKSKSDLAEEVVKLLLELRDVHNKDIKFIRCDNAGENQTLKDLCLKMNFGIQFEFTAPYTPEQNGIVERAFATLYGRVRAMLYASAIPSEYRDGLWTECASTATYLDTILWKKTQNGSSHKMFFGYEPKFSTNLRVFGEIGIVTDRSKIKNKLQDRGIKCYFVGYALQHAGDVYRMFNLDTKKIMMSRDIIWLNKKDKSFNSDTRAGRDKLLEPNPEVNEQSNIPTNRKLLNELKRLNTSYNPTLKDDVEDITDLVFLGAVDSGFLEPQTFEQAWHHPDAGEKEGWHNAIKKEFMSMIEKDVWTKVKKDQVPSNRRLLGTKWVFKKKSSGIF